MGYAQATEGEVMKSEKTAQKLYEEFVADSNADLEALADLFASLKEMQALKGKKRSQAKAALKETDGEIANLAEIKGALHGECDFVLKYFTVIQETMQNEIKACQNTKAILSGSK